MDGITSPFTHCRRCRARFHAYWDRHRFEDDLLSIKKTGICMKCSIVRRVPGSWNPYELGAQGRNDYKMKQRQEAKQ